MFPKTRKQTMRWQIATFFLHLHKKQHFIKSLLVHAAEVNGICQLGTQFRLINRGCEGSSRHRLLDWGGASTVNQMEVLIAVAQTALWPLLIQCAEVSIWTWHRQRSQLTKSIFHFIHLFRAVAWGRDGFVINCFLRRLWLMLGHFNHPTSFVQAPPTPISVFTTGLFYASHKNIPTDAYT